MKKSAQGRARIKALLRSLGSAVKREACERACAVASNTFTEILSVYPHRFQCKQVSSDKFLLPYADTVR